ncbi:sulfotransferase family protein [Cytobacillus kochii]|uniref:sulfotransferase family 2 domain-containing protein n=1 Tax=Cytobacillus kochii TaxID=859143 RepID=UPI0025A030D7|nr:sulfotransferase family 2 domain-containing protein [Cytobacillus kochii]MDM5206499.1 sulfotransferase family 2 domain-containing protein [Cytobacillus kochii]
MTKRMNEIVVKNMMMSSYIPLFSTDFPYVLLWVPKNGCTIVNKWFMYHIGAAGDLSQLNVEMTHNYRDFVLRKRSGYEDELKEELINGEKTIVKIVRNPYRRAVSSFYHALSGEWLLTQLGSTITEGMSFKDYLFKLKSFGESIHVLDKHIAPQYTIGEEQAPICYVKLENLQQELIKLERLAGLKASPMNEIARSSHHFSSRMKLEGDYANRVINFANDEEDLPDLPTVNSLFNEETKALVEEIFAVDLHFYGYKLGEY